MCVGLAVSLVDLEGAHRELRSISATTLVTAIALQVVIVLTLSWRWLLITGAAGASLDAIAAIRLTFLSTLLNLFLPTSVGGDLGRVWLVRRHGLTLYGSALAGVADRTIGLIALGALALFGSWLEPDLLPQTVRGTLWLVVIVSVAGALLASTLLRERGDAPLLSLLRAQSAVPLACLSLAGHGIAVLIAVIIAQDMSSPLPWLDAVTLFPAVLLAASLPVSIGGWGVREVTAITVFEGTGMSADVAVAMTLAFGLTQAAAATLGTLATMVLAWNHRRE